MKKITFKLLCMLTIVLLCICSAIPVFADDGITFSRKYNYIIQKEFDCTPNTFEAWIKLSSYLTDNYTIISNHSNEMYPVIALEVKNKRPNLLWGDPEYIHNYTFNSVNVCTGDWLHLAVTRDFDAKEIRCYVNGKLAETLEMHKTSRELLCSNFTLGGDIRVNNPQNFGGRIRSVAVYNSARTQDQILSDMTNIEKSDFLIAAYEFSSSKIITDISGNGYDAIKTDYVSSYYLEDSQVPALKDYDYTFAVLGDTQIVTEDYPDEFHKIYDWILDNKDSQNIQFVMGLGDITNSSTDKEWNLAMDNILRMKDIVPFSLVRGNHDTTESFNKHYSHDVYKDTVDGTYDNSMINSWKKFTVGKRDFIVFTLDFGPSQEVLNWADEIIEAHPNHNVIITTHSYLFRDGDFHGASDAYAPSTSGGKLNGDQMWDKFVRKHENIILVLSGHTSSDNVIVRHDIGDNGNLITSMLINPQDLDSSLKGLGTVATLHFSDDSNTIQVRYYSSIKEKYFTTGSQLTFNVNFIEAQAPISTPTTEPTKTTTEQSPISTETTTPTDDTSSFDPIIIIICVAAVAIIAVIVVIIIKAQKKEINTKKF